MTRSMQYVEVPSSFWRISAILVVGVLVTCVGTERARGQFTKRWLSVGSFQHNYGTGGAIMERGTDGLQWPAIYPNKDNNRAKGLWIAATNWESEDGDTFPVKMSTIGHYASGRGQMFVVDTRTISKFVPPQTTVDGFQSFDKPLINDAVNPELNADRILINTVNSVTGITMRRRILQFSQAYHDNYHIIEYTFTNTGNVDGDAEQELDQTMEGVYFFFIHRNAVNKESSGGPGPGGTAWGENTMNDDIVGSGLQDLEPEFRVQFSWHGYDPDHTRWNNIGAPAITDDGQYQASGDSTGRLTAPHMIGRAILHADTSPTDDTDDIGQPRTMNWLDNDGPLLATQHSQFDRTLMERKYNEHITAGRAEDHHADVVEPPEPGETWEERMASATNDASLGRPGGNAFTEGFGPYTLEPGDSINIVVAEGAAGLGRRSAVEIGKAYKQAWKAGEPDRTIEYDADGDGTIEPDESMSKNMWVMQSRDSLIKTFRRAYANYESGYDIPRPPKPPREFRVMSGTDRISLEWSLYDGAQPRGFEIYRTQNTYYGAIEDEYEASLIAELGPGERSYEDTSVARGVGYFYFIRVVGDVNQDPTGDTPTDVPLKSSRYYAQSFNPAFLNRPPGEEMSDAVVVPNPYHLNSEKNVRWPDVQDKIGFLDIPGECTIHILTERGELVEKISHTDGSGDEYWDLTTSSNQVVASGIYMAVIEDHTTGRKVNRRFVIIR